MVLVLDARPSPAPVLVAVGPPTAQRRSTAAARPVLALPHIAGLALAAPSVLLVLVVGWSWALVVGRLPRFAAEILTGYVRWLTRVAAYVLLLTDVYPPFTLADAPYPVRVTVRPGKLNRWTVALRLVLGLPALVVAVTATVGLATVVLVAAWFVVVVTGRLPSSLHEGFAGLIRYEARLAGYLAMVTSEYPWGLMGDPEMEPSGMSDPARTVGTSLWQPLPPSPTRDPYWGLVLSSAAKNTVVLFLVLGVASVVAFNITSSVSRYNRLRSDETATTTVQNAYRSLSAVVVGYQNRTRFCGSSPVPLACLTTAAETVSEAFTLFDHRLSVTALPGSAASARARLVADGVRAQRDYAQLSESTSAVHYQLVIASSNLARLLTRFDLDYARLGNELNSLT